KSINITAPPAIVLTTSSTQANCKASDGGASVTVSGGTTPYSYAWSTAATTSAITNVAAGIYNVLVVDNNGCKDSVNASVSNASGPVVKITTVVSDSCTAAGSSGLIDISDSGGVSPYTYSWSNGATTSNINGLAAGAYAVTVTDANGCLGTANTKVNQVPPPVISICMVTVNPINNQNQVIWDKTAAKRIAKYNIYKETTSPGVFGLIGSVKVDSAGIFNDTLSNASVRSWRYEISQVDSCGNESPLSAPHKTMHLTISPGTSSNFNLIWDNYQGLSFGYYIVYRDSVPGQASDSINYVTNNGTYTFSDKPWTTTHNWYYHMGISNPGGCTPAIEAINYNASKSNTGNFTVSGIPQVDAEVNSLEVFPNPSTGIVNVNIALAYEKQNVGVKVINTMGQVLWLDNYKGVSGNVKKQIDLSTYSKGVYIVEVTTGNSTMFRKVVIQ
ncbi:MAG TPA: T9SS type A sorting domain-containing protein, partial [Bacteroidia bacterium]|nr:T9SS type A sorting domain-containing protein [Bacteroidia bacterium]